jgi:hypothetical protein
VPSLMNNAWHAAQPPFASGLAVEGCEQAFTSKYEVP